MTRHHLTDDRAPRLHFDARRTATPSSTSPRARPARRAAARSPNCSTRSPRDGGGGRRGFSATSAGAPAGAHPEPRRARGPPGPRHRFPAAHARHAVRSAPRRHALGGARPWPPASSSASSASTSLHAIRARGLTGAGDSQRAGRAGRSGRPRASPCARSPVGSDDEFLGQIEIAIDSRGAGGAAAARRADAARLGRPRVVLASPLIFRKGLDLQARSRAACSPRATTAISSAAIKQDGLPLRRRAGSRSTSRASSASATASIARSTTPTRRARGFPIATVYLTGEIIHNPHVNDQLRAQGIRFLSDAGESIDALTPDDVVILPAFGVTIELLEALDRARAARWWTRPAARC